jgi:sarcosine oxidase gamma subunit
MNTMSTRTSPIHHASSDPALSMKAELVKIGVKGPGVPAWVQRLGVAFPAKLYDCQQVDGALIVRVGGDELIVEAEANHPLLAKLDEALRTSEPGVYRIEQQSVTIVLRGLKAVGILLQTCSVEMSEEPLDRIVYTRVAGVSCGIIPQSDGGERTYRLWCDYTLAPYLWENLATILSELAH